MSEPSRRLIPGSRLDRLRRILGIKATRRNFKRRLMIESLETRKVLAGFEVTSLLDSTDTSDNVVSLREAINGANGNVGPDTITFNPSLFVSNAASIELTMGELRITDSVTITGPGQALLTINANQRSRVLNVIGRTQIDVKLEGLTLTGGRTTESNLLNALYGYREPTHSGGGVRFDSSGTLTLTGSTVSGNSTAGDFADGGGIFATLGPVTLTGSTVSGNSTAGNYARGSGIFAFRAVTLTGSTVSGNSTAGDNASGGGIYTRNGAVTLTGSTVSGNSTAGDFADGGGISTVSGTVTLNDSTVSGNSTAGGISRGGGISTSSGSVTLTGSTISGNSTSGINADGGGVSTWNSPVTLTGSTVSGNSTAGDGAIGGGISTVGGSVTLTGSTVSGNSTAGDNASGGGISALGSAVTLTGSTVSGNRVTGANSDGGGLWFSYSLVTIVNSTIASNTAKRAGGGFATILDGIDQKLTIHNSIIAGNIATTNPDFTAPTDPATNLEVKSSLIGINAGTTLIASATSDANGNLIGTPSALIDPKIGPLAFNGGATQTHALLVSSPAIDAGDNSLVAGQTNDQRGAPFVRQSGPKVDIGAYEFPKLAPSFFIVTTTTDELDYSNSNVSLREAINSANVNFGSDTITFDASLIASDAASIVLTMGELSIAESVTITGPGQTLLSVNGNQRSRVLNVVGGTRIDVKLEGLTLTGGRTTAGNEVVINDAFETTHSGGGIRFDSSGTLTLTDSTVSGNSTAGALADGGGIFTSSGAVTLTGSTVSGNSTAGPAASGGGIFAPFGAVTLTGSTISGNSTAGNSARGGGIFAGSGEATLTGSTVSGNSTKGGFARGGGLYSSSGTVTLTGSTISGNSTAGGIARGGGIFTVSGAVTLTGSTVSRNSTSGYATPGGGIFTYSGAVTLTGSTVSGNRVTGTNADGGGVWFDDSLVTIVNSTITGNTATRAGGGLATRVNSIDKKLTIHNSIIAGNTATTNPDFTAPYSPPMTATNLEVKSSLIGTNAGTTLTVSATADANGNRIGAPSAQIDPQLGPLAFNGGATQTHALLATSPAIDVGSGALLPAGTLVDQRGVVRVIDLPGIVNAPGGGGVDIGAVEMVGVSIDAASTLESDGTLRFTVTLSHAIPAGSSATVQFSTANIGNQAIAGMDYVPVVNQTVTFIGGGALTQTVNVVVTNDTQIENVETFTGTINNAVNAITTGLSAVGTITSDDDIAGFTLSKTNAVVSESATTDSFTVLLIGQPVSDVVIAVTSADTGEAIVDKASLTFTAENWDVPQTVMITGVDDTLVDGNQFALVTLSIDDANSNNAFDPLSDQAVSVTTTDNDDPGFTVAQTAGSTTVTEAGSTDTFTVVLTAQPLSDVVITVISASTGEATVDKQSLTFNSANWNVPQVVTVTGVNDAIEDGSQNSFITLSIDDANSDNAFDPLADQTVNVTTTDDDVTGFALSKTNAVVSESATTDSFNVVLTAQPVSNVVITVISADTGEATVDKATLTFTAANWNVPQRLTVTGVNDSLVDGSQNTLITLSIDDANSDNAFDPLADQTVNVTTTDDEVAGFALSKTNAAVSESANTDNFTVVLTGQPLSDVVVTVTSADTGEAIVDKATLTFTAANWNVPQTVMITGVDDASVDGNQVTLVTLSIDDANSDNAFDPLVDQTVNVTTTDNDSPGFTVAQTAGSTTVTEAGSTDTFTVVLTAQPISDVVITVTSANIGEATVDKQSLTFTNAN